MKKSSAYIGLVACIVFLVVIAFFRVSSQSLKQRPSQLSGSSEQRQVSVDDLLSVTSCVKEIDGDVIGQRWCSQEQSSIQLKTALSNVLLMLNTPAKIPVAVKDAVGVLNARDRLSMRLFLAREYSANTNRKIRLSLIDSIVDPTTWTNMEEKTLSDVALVDCLKRAYQDDGYAEVRDRLGVALLVKSDVTTKDAEWIDNLVRSGRWDAIPLALRWRDYNLEKYIKDVLASSAAWPWDECRTIRIYPYFYVAEEINTTITDRREWLKLSNRLGPQDVVPRDLLIACLAWFGDKHAISWLEDKFQQATFPVADRKLIQKDKLYWYSLLCLTGKLPGPLPIP